MRGEPLSKGKAQQRHGFIYSWRWLIVVVLNCKFHYRRSHRSKRRWTLSQIHKSAALEELKETVAYFVNLKEGTMPDEDWTEFFAEESRGVFGPDSNRRRSS